MKVKEREAWALVDKETGEIIETKSGELGIYWNEYVLIIPGHEIVPVRIIIEGE